jgi:hypothetical protein
LEQFPGRTVTDLYLWVVERRDYLKSVFGNDPQVEPVVNENEGRGNPLKEQ